MNDIEVSLTWQTGFATQEEVDRFLSLIGEVHNQMYYAPGIAYDKLAKDGFYQGTKNYIEVNVKDNRQEPGVFNPGDAIIVKGVSTDNPNHEGKVDFVDEMTKLVHVSNMNMPYAGSLNRFFNADELEHV